MPSCCDLVSGGVEQYLGLQHEPTKRDAPGGFVPLRNFLKVITML